MSKAKDEYYKLTPQSRSIGVMDIQYKYIKELEKQNQEKDFEMMQRAAVIKDFKNQLKELENMIKNYKDENFNLKSENNKLENKNKWISTKERLPDKPGLYLVYNKWGIRICIFSVEDGEFMLSEYDYWMNLPSKPEVIDE